MGEDVQREGSSWVSWEIEPVGDSCLPHDQLQEGADSQLYGGWPTVLSGIQTPLEIGKMLTTPGLLRWLRAPKTSWPKSAPTSGDETPSQSCARSAAGRP